MSSIDLPLAEPVAFNMPDTSTEPPLIDRNRVLARRRAQTLLRHYPRAAVSEEGRAAAQRYLDAPDEESFQSLLTLPDRFFESYIGRIEKRSRWSRAMIELALDRTAMIEVSSGCHYDCAMCYIDAPKVNGSIPWPHMREIVGTLAERQRHILADEFIDVLVQEALAGREPATSLDAVLLLARHRRNRFNNMSGNLMLYWRSNPTNWRDPLFDRHFGHIAELIRNSFRIADAPALAAAVEADPMMRELFQRECGGSIRKLDDMTTVQAIVSTIPYTKGSIGDQAVQYILKNEIANADQIRISAPHPNLVPARSNQSDGYWEDLVYTLRSTEPAMVYLFASNIDELRELAAHIASSYEHSERQWWIESRLALYEIDRGRSRGDVNDAIFAKLQRSLKRLSFIATAEGRAKQFGQNPFFAGRGTVMCVNGAVLGVDGQVHYQACTTPEGEDVDEGECMLDLQARPEGDVRMLLNAYPLVNRARESVTPNLGAIPLRQRRRPVDWFETKRCELRADARYEEIAMRMRVLAERTGKYLLI